MRTLLLWTMFHVGFILGLFGCVGMPTVEMDWEFRPHFERFIDLCKQHGTVRNYEKCVHAHEVLRSIKLVDKFHDNHPTVLAYCYREKDKHTIEIRRAEWYLLSYDSKSRLLGHELGHCILEQEHTPFGLMTEYFPSNEMPTDELIIEAVGSNQ